MMHRADILYPPVNMVLTEMHEALHLIILFSGCHPTKTQAK